MKDHDVPVHPVQVGYYVSVDFISTAIVSSVTYLEIIYAIFVMIFSYIDTTLSLLIFYKELLMELFIFIVFHCDKKEVTKSIT